MPAGRVDPCEVRDPDGPLTVPPAAAGAWAEDDGDPLEAAGVAFDADAAAPGRMTPVPARVRDEPRPAPPAAPAMAAAMAGVRAGPRSPRASRRCRMVT